MKDGDLLRSLTHSAVLVFLEAVLVFLEAFLVFLETFLVFPKALGHMIFFDQVSF